MAAGPQLAEELGPIEDGHAEIEHDDVEIAPIDVVERLAAVGCGLDVVIPAENELKEVLQRRVVIDNEDRGALSTPWVCGI